MVTKILHLAFSFHLAIYLREFFSYQYLKGSLYLWEMTILEGIELSFYLTKGKNVKIILDYWLWLYIENQYSHIR